MSLMRASTLTQKRARALLRDMSLPEVVLWEHLRNRRLRGLRFRRQHPLGPFILDFCCAEARVAVEVDGASHDAQDRVADDRRREMFLAEMGVLTLRCSAVEVLDRERIEGVLGWIGDGCERRLRGGGVARPLHRLRRSPSPAAAQRGRIKAGRRGRRGERSRASAPRG